jgi:hypothetical protein
MPEVSSAELRCALVPGQDSILFQDGGGSVDPFFLGFLSAISNHAVIQDFFDFFYAVARSPIEGGGGRQARLSEDLVPDPPSCAKGRTRIACHWLHEDSTRAKALFKLADERGVCTLSQPRLGRRM